jgi:hypothetical protein
VRTFTEGVTHISELNFDFSLGVSGAVSVVEVEVLDLLSAARGSRELDSVGETLRNDALLFGDLVSLVAGDATGIAFEVESHGGGRRAASSLLEGAFLVERGTADIALVVLEELFVLINTIVGSVGGGSVLVEDCEVVAETAGSSGGAHDVHGFAVAEGRRVALSFGDLGDSAAVGAALLVITFDHGDITSSVDEGDGGNRNDESCKESEDLGHFLIFV